MTQFLVAIDSRKRITCVRQKCYALSFSASATAKETLAFLKNCAKHETRGVRKCKEGPIDVKLI